MKPTRIAFPSRLAIWAGLFVAVTPHLPASPLYIPATQTAPAKEPTARDLLGQPLSAPAGNITQTQSTGASTLGSASLSITDQLNLVTASIFNGGIRIFDLSPNVFITSTLPASKPAAGTGSKYQDSEMLMPHGGVLNLFFSSASVNVSNATKLAGIAAKEKSSIGREALADRHYFHDLEKIVADDTAQAYLLNGIGVRMLNRNVDATTSPNVSNYGLSGFAYLGVGADGAFIPVKGSSDPTGNYRLEFSVQGAWTDSLTMKTLYPSAAGVKQFTYSAGANFQIAITKKLGVNVQAGWPLGPSKDYMAKILLAGVTLAR